MNPFYMTFPMQNLFQAELEYEKDLERMKELYPREVSRIAEMVSDRCDELEFEGSRIYDENPDRRMMAREAQALYEKIKKELRGENPGAQPTEDGTAGNEGEQLTEDVSYGDAGVGQGVEAPVVEDDRESEQIHAADESGAGCMACAPGASAGAGARSDMFGLLPPREWKLQAQSWQPEPSQMPPLISPPQTPPLSPPPQTPPGLQPPPQTPSTAPLPPDGSSDWLDSVVGILLADEIYKRRCRYRRSKRWW